MRASLWRIAPPIWEVPAEVDMAAGALEGFQRGDCRAEPRPPAPHHCPFPSTVDQWGPCLAFSLQSWAHGEPAMSVCWPGLPLTNHSAHPQVSPLGLVPMLTSQRGGRPSLSAPGAFNSLFLQSLHKTVHIFRSKVIPLLPSCRRAQAQVSRGAWPPRC